MGRHPRSRRRLAASAVFLVLLGACGHGDLPEVPYFELLGFDDSLEVVREQVRGVYEQMELDPLDAERNGRLAMHLSAYRKEAAAEIFYRRARALAPDEFRWTYYLAFTLMDMGRSDEAAQMFREALTLRPDYVESKIQLANLLFKSEDTQESLALFEEISTNHPDRVEGWLGLGKIHNRLGDSEAAVTALDRAKIVGPQFGEIHYALAQALRALGERDKAQRALTLYESLKNNKIRPADELLLEVGALNASDAPHMAQGLYQREHAQFDAAAQSFRAALAVNPANQDAWIELVAVLAELGDIDAAGATYRDALAAGIEYAPLHVAYGEALLDMRQLDGARAVFDKAIELDPQSAPAYAGLGRIDMLGNDAAAATEQFRRSLSARPDDVLVQFYLARALNAAGQYEEAEKRLTALTGDRTLDTARVLQELALARHGLGRMDEARATLERAREAAWQSANVRAADSIEELLREWQQAP